MPASENKMTYPDIIYHNSPDIYFGSCLFRSVPTLIQVKDIPMLQVVKSETAGYRIEFSVYHSDGTYLAKVKGSRIHLTDAGKAASVSQRHYPDLTVCELDGKPIMELRREGPAALKGHAELYAPEGVLIKSLIPHGSEMFKGDGHLAIGGQLFMDAHFEGHPIGIHYNGDGNWTLGIKHFRYSGPADKPLPYASIKPR